MNCEENCVTTWSETTETAIEDFNQTGNRQKLLDDLTKAQQNLASCLAGCNG